MDIIDAAKLDAPRRGGERVIDEASYFRCEHGVSHWDAAECASCRDDWQPDDFAECFPALGFGALFALERETRCGLRPWRGGARTGRMPLADIESEILCQLADEFRMGCDGKDSQQ